MQNNNLFSQMMVFFMLTDDITNDKIINEIHLTYSEILNDILEEKKWISDLDFNIVRIKDMNEGYKIVPNNAITAFWTSGILIDCEEEIKPYMRITYEGVTYWFDEKQKKLKFK